MIKSLPRVLVLLAVFASCSFTNAITLHASEEQEIGVLMLIQNATTPREHMRLAAYFTKQAEKMEAKKEQHNAMAALYQKKQKNSEAYKQCLNISRNDEEAAREYRSLALWHRVLAHKIKEDK